MRRIRLLIADDHTLVRQALAELFKLQEDLVVVGEAADGEEAFAKAGSLSPDIVLMDIAMPPGQDGGVHATRRITEKYPQIRVVVLTMHTEDEYLFEAIKSGAKGYVLKNADSRELLKTIRAVHQGEVRLNPSMAPKILEEFRRLSTKRADSDFIHLTEREKEILKLVAKGASNKEIAKELNLEEKTVRNRLSVIFDKLHINNRTQAALYALREGLSKLK